METPPEIDAADADAAADPAARRKLRTRARTLLTVDETVEQIGLTTVGLTAALGEFNTALDRFNDSLDRFSDAADQLNLVASRLNDIVDKIDPLLTLVLTPLNVARRLVPGTPRH